MPKPEIAKRPAIVVGRHAQRAALADAGQPAAAQAALGVADPGRCAAGLVGRWISRSVETAMRERRVSELTTVLNADVAALRVWMTEQAIDAEFIADDERLCPPSPNCCTAAERQDRSGAGA